MARSMHWSKMNVRTACGTAYHTESETQQQLRTFPGFLRLEVNFGAYDSVADSHARTRIEQGVLHGTIVRNRKRT